MKFPLTKIGYCIQGLARRIREGIGGENVRDPESSATAGALNTCPFTLKTIREVAVTTSESETVRDGGNSIDSWMGVKRMMCRMRRLRSGGAAGPMRLVTGGIRV